MRHSKSITRPIDFISRREAITTKPGTVKPLEVLLREARESASKYNPGLRTYAGAAEELGVADGNSVGKWERGECVPSNHNMLAMAEAYNAPELALLYCSRVCPIGQQRMADPHLGSLEGQALQLYVATRGLEPVIETAIRVAADGKISPEEVTDLEAALQGLNTLARAVESYRAGVQKALGGVQG